MLELAPGTTLGSYIITARIGRGGMASVYQAHHPALDRNVAIKVLSPSLADQAGFLERFRREARTASRLRHRNILTVYDFGETDGIAYMVTELLPGGTLADRLGRPLAFTEVLRVLRGIGSALDAAHEAGLIHRDVKPSNILYTRDGEPILADFGIARLIEAEENLTAQGALIGTPHYMAPEMASGGVVSRASDLYSLGVVLYEMLSGEPPFPRQTPLATVRAHIDEEPPLLSARHADAGPEVQAIITKALAKDPAERFKNGAALAAAFEDAILAGDPPTPRPGTIRPVTANVRPPAARDDRGSFTSLPRNADPAAASLPPYAGQVPPRYDPRDAYGAVIPGPPVAHAAPPGAHTERWPAGAPPPGTPVRHSGGAPWMGILALVLVALLVAAGAYLVRSTDLASAFGGRGATATVTRAPGTSPALPPTPGALLPGSGTPPVTSPPPTVAALTSPSAPTPSVAAVRITPSPVAEVLPSATPSATILPTVPPTEAVPTPTPDTRRGPLAAQFVSPANGAVVPARPPIVGRRTGLQTPDEHLWMLIHPDGGADNWWPYKGELIADRDGGWRIDDVEIGGPAGSRHVLAIGMVDADGQREMQEQIRDRQD
jgi:serine/threonine protein kinase